MSVSAATRPTAAKTAPTVNADENPSTSACGTAAPPRTASSVCVVAIVDSAAMPSAPPICWEVLIRPEARPASEAFTPASAAITFVGVIVSLFLVRQSDMATAPALEPAEAV